MQNANHVHFQILSRTSLPQSTGYWVSAVEWVEWFPARRHHQVEQLKKKTQNSNEVYPQMGCDHCSQNIKLQLRYWTACDYWALWLVTNMCLVWLKTWFGSRHWSPWSDFSHAILSTTTQKNSKFKWNLSADGLWSPALKTWNYNCVIGLLVNIELYGSYERTCVECTWVTAFAMEWFLARRQRLAVQLNENLKLSL